MSNYVNISKGHDIARVITPMKKKPYNVFKPDSSLFSFKATFFNYSENIFSMLCKIQIKQHCAYVNMKVKNI